MTPPLPVATTLPSVGRYIPGAGPPAKDIWPSIVPGPAVDDPQELISAPLASNADIKSNRRPTTCGGDQILEIIEPSAALGFSSKPPLKSESKVKERKTMLDWNE